MDPNANNGMITKIWGPPSWVSLHSISFGYPLNPSDEQKNTYKSYFTLVGDVLPCRYCRESYKKFISEGCTKLTDDCMKNRETLSRWLYDVHEAVNKKLGIDYGVSYEDVKQRYETYRAKCTKTPDPKVKGCIVPLDKKANSYSVAQQKDCPIVPYDLVKRFVGYARKRKIDPKYFKLHIDLNNSTRDTDVWQMRNNECKQLIEKMRSEGIDSIEQNGVWKGMPTKEETILLLMHCSNMPKDEIAKIVLLVRDKRKKYYLTSD